MLSVLIEQVFVLGSVLVFAVTVLGLIALMDRGTRAIPPALARAQAWIRASLASRRRTPSLSA